MAENIPHGVFIKYSLNDVELADARALADICASYEDIDLRIGWSALQGRASDAPQDFLYYQDGALLGFLSLFGVGAGEAEGGGMVHPRYRRKGVFTALVAAARAICRQHNTSALVLVCDRRSDGAKAFFESLGAAHTFSEHLMKLESPAAIVPPDGRLDFHRARPADAAAIAAIIAEDAGMDVTLFRQVVAGDVETGARQYYVAKAGGETIGTINVDVIDGAPYIYGFVIRPEHRGRGYGKQMLACTIADIVAERPQPIFLEVETDNTPALGLYHAFGFTITRTYDYYRVEI
jgi:ribosomal protein S18 acetylase RimI-like enzyme